jgi:hypothetical protein
MRKQPDAGTEQVRVRGGATLPSATAHRLNASWPLGRLVISECGIEISAHLFPDRWAVLWEDIARVMVSSRTVVLIPRTGRGARFLFMSHAKVEPILEILQSHGVPMEKVKSTIRAAWTL